MTRGRRPLPSDLADAARSAVPMGLLILAAAVPIARPVVLAALAAGFAVAVRRDAPVRWAWAAPIPGAATFDAATKTVFSSARQSSAFSLYGFDASHQPGGERAVVRGHVVRGEDDLRAGEDERAADLGTSWQMAIPKVRPAAVNTWRPVPGT